MSRPLLCSTFHWGLSLAHSALPSKCPLMSQPATYQTKRSTVGHPSSTPLECFMTCSLEASCMSWSYDTKAGFCYMFTDVRLNGYDDRAFAGVKVYSVPSYLCTTYMYLLYSCICIAATTPCPCTVFPFHPPTLPGLLVCLWWLYHPQPSSRGLLSQWQHLPLSFLYRWAGTCTCSCMFLLSWSNTGTFLWECDRCMYICFMLLWRFQCIHIPRYTSESEQTLWACVTISYTILLCTHMWNLIVQLTHCGCYNVHVYMYVLQTVVLF